MRNLFKHCIASIILSSLLFFASSCKKSETNAVPTTPVNSCGTGVSFCVKIGSEQITGTGRYIIITTGAARQRILWEDGTGAAYRNVELDIYASSLVPGTYTFSTSPATGQAALQYYTGGMTFLASAGSVTITSASATSVSGTFSGTVTNGSDTRTVANGNIVNAAP